MVGVRNDQRGFTLSELLIAVAILLVLGALAMPSVLSASRGAHMAELNAGASGIAEAAQNQMTAMKVNGTWLDLFEGKDPDADHALNLPASIPNASDYYYFTAQEARDNGVLPGGAVESAVRDNDFIIEYNRSTATVVGVFYSDGKAGIFGTATGGTPAEDYYKSMGSSAGRSAKAREAADPMVGYYEGTPTGATNTVALENPAIWVDDSTGTLNVQNPNLTDHPTWNTSLEVTIYHTDATTDAEKATFVLGGLQQGAGTYSLSVPGGTADNRDNKEPIVFKLDARTTSTKTSIGQDVFQIDMSALLQALSTSKDANLAALAAAYAANDPITVEAKVTTTQKPCVPSTAKAHVVWTDPVVQLRVLVTDPKGLVADTPGNPSRYTDPTVAFEVNETGLQLIADTKTIDVTGGTGLSADAGRQVYTGGKASLKDLSGAKAVLRATAGKFTFRDYYSVTYQYQVYEVWVNGALAGSYDSSGKWNWQNGLNDSGFMTLCDDSGNPVSADAGSVMKSIGTFVKIDTGILAESGITGDASNELTVTVRTAPIIKDVESAVFGSASGSYGIEENTTVSARQTDVISTKIQSNFEMTFGCSSSVALWSMKRGNEVGYSNSNNFDANNLYAYYGPTPYDPNANSDLTTSVAIKYNKQGNWYSRDSAGFALGQNLESDPRIDAAAGETGLRKPGIVRKTNNADFSIPTDMGYLYYRIITYYQDDAQPLSTLASFYNPVWMPYLGLDVAGIVQNDTYQYQFYPDKTIPYYENGKYVKDETVTQWKDANGANYPLGAYIRDYTNTLPLGLVKLNPIYFRNGAGVMYLELNPGNAVTGYAGYVNGTAAKTQPLLPDSNEISKWGYYVIAEKTKGTQVKPTVSSTISPTLTIGNGINITIDGEKYTAYPLSGNGLIKSSSIDVSLSYQGTATEFVVNLNFANAVAMKSDTTEYEGWGTRIPWQVRHATQFPAALDPWGQRLQAAYMTKNYSFSQTHDLDMKDLKNASNTKPIEAFTGTYNGNGYAIYDFSEQLTAEQKRNTGLFNSIENATLMNMNLVDTTSSTRDIKTQNGVQAAFGCLTGTARNSVITRCTVSGGVTADKALQINYKVAHQVNLGEGKVSAAGGLVGNAINTYIDSCTVKNLAITYSVEAEGVQWDDSSPLGMGGLVGRYEVTSLMNSRNANYENIIQSSSDIRNVTLESGTVAMDQNNRKGCIAFGGVVGYFQRSGDAKAEIIAQTTRLPDTITYIIPGGTLGTTVKAGIDLGTSNETVRIDPGGGSNVYLWIDGIQTVVQNASGDGF